MIIYLHDHRHPTILPISSDRTNTYAYIPFSSFFRRILPSGCTDSGSSMSPQPGYDIVILSDLLHFDRSHGALIASLTSLLSKSRTSQVYISAGKYTPSHVCDNFLMEGTRAGLVFEEGVILTDGGGDDDHDANSDTTAWLGNLEVSGLDKEQLSARKAMCRWWVGRWA
jgi:nicotinamide N-methyltransferase